MGSIVSSPFGPFIGQTQPQDSEGSTGDVVEKEITWCTDEAREGWRMSPRERIKGIHGQDKWKG